MRTVIGTFKFFSDKRFSTIAGTLVYFFIMSIAPFTLWLTLVCGNVDIERFLSHELFESVSPFLRYMKSSAEGAASGAGIVLIVTSLYSSTNFFYHLRRSGEIIYDAPSVKGGLRLRLASLVLIFAAFLLVALIAAMSIAGSWILDEIMPIYLSDIISYVFITATAFTVALVLNIFACPFRLKAEEAVPGSLLTTLLWLICLVGFGIYMHFANPERLYGKIASIIVFLLWCYIMMTCFVVGVIYNGMFKSRRVMKKLF
ncbi:MAG: YihY/virulence factor BrkB family protein [Clostridia bacterium]|nr:YihY/virulence factor BrkB family protein [Clostridia bacterium]